MTYWGLNLPFLAIAAAAGIAALVVRRRRHAPRARLADAVIVVGILLVMTAVFDNIMIGIGLVGYDEAKISGAFIGIAPLEDFAYAVAALVLLPSLWVLLERRPVAGPERNAR